MLSAYPACFFREESGYSVIFPDLNYLATCGKNLEEALSMAIDCLAGYLYWCKHDKDIIPKPSPLNKISASNVSKELGIDYSESSDSFVNLVTVDVEEYAREHFEKAVKKTLTIPAWLNNAALQQNINFSQVLQEALKEQLHVK